MIESYFIRPLQLRDYLKVSGWQRIASPFDSGEYAFRHDETKREIRFPLDDEEIGYADALDFAYSKLSSVTGKTPRTLFQEILSVDTDMVLLKMDTPRNRPSLSFEAAEKSISAIDRIIRSAASTVRRPQANYKRLGFSEASRMVQESRLEQTDIGSFVLRVSCPIRALDDEAQLAFLETGTSFVRRVFETIHDSTKAVVRAIISDQIEEFASSVLENPRPLVSANFCASLAQVADASDRNDVDFRWSPIIPKEQTQPIRISSEYISRLEDLSSRLQSEDAADEETFIGTVERLDGQTARDGRRAGEVVLSLLQSDESETVRARVDLNADQYSVADQAHMAGNAFVRVIGRLLPGRQPRRLEVVSFDKIS